jgi:threonine aldolase
MFGGGMRQAGIIAAGALYALENHRARLSEDHANARRLAEGIARLPSIELDPATVETNIVIFRTTSMPPAQWVARLKDAGVLVLAGGPDTVRAVTHLDVSREQVDEAVAAFRRVAAG